MSRIVLADCSDISNGGRVIVYGHESLGATGARTLAQVSLWTPSAKDAALQAVPGPTKVAAIRQFSAASAFGAKSGTSLINIQLSTGAVVGLTYEEYGPLPNTRGVHIVPPGRKPSAALAYVNLDGWGCSFPTKGFATRYKAQITAVPKNIIIENPGAAGIGR